MGNLKFKNKKEPHLNREGSNTVAFGGERGIMLLRFAKATSEKIS